MSNYIVPVNNDDPYAMLPGITKQQAYELHAEQLAIAIDDMEDAGIRARYNIFMIYQHNLWKTIINPETMVPAYANFTEWVEDHPRLGMSTARKYIGQMRMLAAAGYTDIANADTQVLEYLWGNAIKESRGTGEVLKFKGQPPGVSPKEIIHQAMNEVGYRIGGDGVPPAYKSDALHQIVNPLEPRIWMERTYPDRFVFSWNKMTYPDGGDNPAEKLTGDFSISFNGHPPGDVVATIMKLLKVFT